MLATQPLMKRDLARLMGEIAQRWLGVTDRPAGTHPAAYFLPASRCTWA